MGNYKKITIWSVNIVLFMAVVYMGITQAGMGAEISVLEDRISSSSETRQQLSEKILLTNSTTTLSQKSQELGFTKPSQIVYIDSIESFASLLPQR